MTAEQIKQIIKSANISIVEVATRMGISKQALYQRLKVKSISAETIYKIAEATNIPIAVFFDDDIASHITKLQTENEMLREVLAEKERTIQILLNIQNKQ